MSNLKVLVVLAICNALSPLALQILAPALPSIRLDLDASLAQTQMILSAFSLALAVSMLVYGPLSDRYDKKRLLMFGMLVFSVGSLVGFFSNSIEVLIVARVLQAVGAGAASTITRAMAADTYKGDDLNRAMSAMMMVVVIGPMLAPILGGYIVDTSSWTNIMAVLLALGMAMALLAMLFLERSQPAAGHPATISSYWTGFSDVIGNRSFQTNMAVLGAIQIGVYAFIAASPFLIMEVLGYTAAQYGLVFMYLTAGYMVGNFFSGFVVKKLGSARLVFLATGIYGLGAILFIGFSLGGIHNLAAISGPAILLTFTNGVTQPNCGAGALASVEGKKGVAASLSGFGQIMAGAVGFQIMGYLGVTSTTPLAILIGICSVIGILAATRLIAERKDPASSQQ